MTQSSSTRGWWLGAAQDCLARMEETAANADPTLNKNGPTFAAMARAVGEHVGWDDPRVKQWFDTALAVRSPSGAWGVGASLDGLPTNTNFMITTACFTAPHLAAGFANNVAPSGSDPGRTLVTQASMDQLLDTVRNWPAYAYPYGISGQPVALPDYSASYTGAPTSQHSQERIWNISAAAAAFLLYNRNRHSVAAAQSDCLTKGTNWKNGVQWAMNRPTNFGGWLYQGIYTTGGSPTPVRSDGGHNWVCANLVPWLGTAPMMTQLAAGVVPGDSIANPSDPWAAYLAGAVALMAEQPAAAGYLDVLVGRVINRVDASMSSTDPGGHAVNAINLLHMHKNGLL
jgi:hypothetical protein